MTSTGKIARLSKHIRDQLNQRLDDGQSAEDILPWLNGLPECKEMLAEKFDSHPITRQNLSHWKNGGYQTWLHVQQAREKVQSLFEHVQEIETDDEREIANDGMSIADRLGTLVAVQLLTALQKLEDITDPDQRWQRLTDITIQLSRLRREDHHGRRVRLAEEQWRDQCERQEIADERAGDADRKEKRLKLIESTLNLSVLAQTLGGGEYGRRYADLIHRVQNDLPLPEWYTQPRPANHSPAAKPTPPSEPRSPDRPGPQKKPRSSVARRSETKAATWHAPNKTKTVKSAPPVPIPSPDTPPALPKSWAKPGHARTSPSPSVKLNPSKSNQQHANVPSAARPAAQPNPGSSRHSFSEDGSKSNVGQASRLSPSSSQTTQSTPSTERPDLSGQQCSTPAAAAVTNSDNSEAESTPASSTEQKPNASNRPPP